MARFSCHGFSCVDLTSLVGGCSNERKNNAPNAGAGPLRYFAHFLDI
jgi:hypothetical protein